MKKAKDFISGMVVGGFIIYLVSLAYLSYEFGRMADHKQCSIVNTK